jgi:hypothetical protein
MKRVSGPTKVHYLARVSTLLLIAALIAGMAGCDGNPSQNLEIRTWYDLDAVRDNPAANYTLMNDLDSSTAGYLELASPTAHGGKGWQPIGPALEPQFTGRFDGRGYEVRDLFINRPDEYDVGLFGFVNKGGVIENIGLVNANVTGNGDVGGLVGSAQNDGTVSNSYATGAVTGNQSVGGLVGFVASGTVSNSYSAAEVTADSLVGGLVGNLFSGIVEDCYSKGTVTGGWGVGGLVGNSYGTVSNCYSSGNVTGDEDVGGLVGLIGAAVFSSFWDTETSGLTTSAGGTGMNTTQMQEIATFSGAGWNITAVADLNTRNPSYIWNIVNDMTYPFLSWQSI